MIEKFIKGDEITCPVYGDKMLFENNKMLYKAHIIVYFKSKNEKYNVIEDWGEIKDYKYKE